MATLTEILLSEDNEASVILDCVKLVESEVAKKTGITGVLIKSVFKVVTKLGGNIIEKFVRILLPDFAKGMNPFYQKFQKQKTGVTFEAFLSGNPEDVANALLGITDQYASKAKNKVLKSSYDKLRGIAMKQVIAAVPGIGKIVAKYI